MKITKSAVSKMVGLVLSLNLVGCDNATKVSVCDGAKDPIPEGLTGDYRFNYRGEDFSVESSKVAIHAEKGSFTAKVASIDSRVTATICQIGAYTMIDMEGVDPTPGFSVGRLYITNAGLHIQPLLFDKRKLDGANIPYSIVTSVSKLSKYLPSTMNRGLATLLSSVSDEFEWMLIENTSVEPQTLLQNASTASIGLTWFRQ